MGSDIDGGEGYSVAQFQRTMNPAFRSSSPQPSTYESHNDPQCELAAQMGHPAPPPNLAQQPPNLAQQPPPLDLRRGGQPPPNYDPEQHGEINKIPHNAYPTDGMTMFCRTGPPSERSSAASAYRPSSRDSQSDVSNPTSMSSVEAPAPVAPAFSMKPPASKPASKPAPKPAPKPASSAPLPSQDDTQIQKKKTAFFSNSPFRRKSRHDKERPTIVAQPAARSPWNSPTKHSSPTKVAPPPTAQPERLTGSPEPVDPRANFQLNVGNNVFDVASPDKNGSKAGAQPATAAEEDLDPIARALADLKTTGNCKQSSLRVSADRYHGITTPTPSASSSSYGGSSSAAPPPAYNDPSVKRLDAPEPAFTSKQMQKTTQRYTGQTQSMLRGGSNNPAMAPRDGGKPQEVPRARSPAPSRSPAPRRSASPQVSPRVDTRSGQYSGGGASPSPTSYQSSSVRSRYSQSPTPHRPQDPPYTPNDYVKRASPAASTRAVSPQPQFRQQARPSSAGGMELQLSGGQVDMYGGGSQNGYGSTRHDGRPSSYYGDAAAPPVGRSRSRTLAVADPGRKFSRDGRPVLHFGKIQHILFPIRTPWG